MLSFLTEEASKNEDDIIQKNNEMKEAKNTFMLTITRKDKIGLTKKFKTELIRQLTIKSCYSKTSEAGTGTSEATEPKGKKKLD